MFIDGRVQHHHELREAEHAEDQPAPAAVRGVLFWRRS